jgi:general secretion pathway protein B
MSFILDALKKSENERQRTIGPSLADAPVLRHRSERPWWAFAVAGLLVVNLGVLLIVLTREDDSAQVAPAVTPPPAAAAPAANPPVAAVAAPAAPATRPPATSPAVRSLAEEAGTYQAPWPDYDNAAFEPSGNPQLAAAANVPAGPSIVRPINAPAVAPLQSRPPFEARAAVGNEASNEVLPTAGSLIASGASLPDLHLDIHVYSNNPAERFVFVNMRKYQEGQTLTEGPTIERITPDGAILNQQGLRYLQPRQ